jgi:hypothetical protein
MTNEINGNAISRDEIVSYAQMSETGDYGADCATGRLVADALIKRMADTENGTLALAAIVREIVNAGRWEAVHTGFFQRLADRSVQGAA